jgi:hypothetical protein
MLSRGFPTEGDADEYTTYFLKIFGDDKERQRQYLAGILSEDQVTLSAGNRVLGAMLATGLTRTVFTTNFDTVVEKAVAEVSGRTLSAYHLEGPASANRALSNEEFPFYCKLHGDFRYDSIRNLKSDLAAQNADLSRALVNAANRFGFIVAGYSGRDASVMDLFRSALSTNNPFPHGIYWTSMKNAPVLPSVTELIDEAKAAGVNASLVEVETFDAFMLRLWRNLDGKEPAIDAKVKRSARTEVRIPQPAPGTGQIIRMNALPIAGLPKMCQSILFATAKEWRDLRTAAADSGGRLIFTKSESVLCWGGESIVKSQFSDVVSISPFDLSAKIADIGNNLNIQAFLEEALCQALARDRPLLTRTTRTGSHLIADALAREQSALDPLRRVVHRTSGLIEGLFTQVDEEHPEPEKIYWAESVRVSITVVDGRNWLLLDPDVWIWPTRARRDATAFLDKRRGGRYNKVSNEMLDAWLLVLFGDHDRDDEYEISAYDDGSSAETPTFRLGTRTAYTRRLLK